MYIISQWLEAKLRIGKRTRRINNYRDSTKLLTLVNIYYDFSLDFEPICLMNLILLNKSVS